MIAIGTSSPTDGALQAMATAGVSPATLLDRHARGDHGEINPYDFGLTDDDLADTVTSIYLLSTGYAIWVTTKSYPAAETYSMVGRQKVVHTYPAQTITTMLVSSWDES